MENGEESKKKEQISTVRNKDKGTNKKKDKENLFLVAGAPTDES